MSLIELMWQNFSKPFLSWLSIKLISYGTFPHSYNNASLQSPTVGGCNRPMAPAAVLWNPSLCWCRDHSSQGPLPANDTLWQWYLDPFLGAAGHHWHMTWLRALHQPCQTFAQLPCRLKLPVSLTPFPLFFTVVRSTSQSEGDPSQLWLLPNFLSQACPLINCLQV